MQSLFLHNRWCRAVTTVTFMFMFAVFGRWATPVRAALTQPMTVTIMTYNIHHGERLDGVIDLAGQADFMRSTGADIIGLQEVDVGTARTARVDQAAFLAKSLGFHYVFTSHFPHQGGEYGLALLSRYPIVAHESVALPTEPGTEAKSLLKATVDVNGTFVDMYVIHYEVRNIPVRQAQSEAAATVVMAGKHPAVIMGDFNDQAYSQVSVPLRYHMMDTYAAGRFLAPASHMEADPRGQRTYTGGGATYPVIDARVRADSLWHTPEWLPVGAVDAPPSEFSDHRPAIVTLQLPAADREALALPATWPAANEATVFIPERAGGWLRELGMDAAQLTAVLQQWLEDENIPSTVVTDYRDIPRGSIVILPGGRFLTAAEMNGLREHALHGGGILAWGDAGVESPDGDPVRADFEALFGMRYLGWSYGYPTRDAIVLPGDAATWPGDMPESAAFWLFEGPIVQPLPGARVLGVWRAADGETPSHREEMNAAVVQNGRAVYVSTIPVNLGDRHNPDLRALVTGLVGYMSAAQGAGRL